MENDDMNTMTNAQGVIIKQEPGHHAKATNAQCGCGCGLIVAPPLMSPKHEKGNPIMVCEDHGIHAHWFRDLVVGKQSEIKRTRDFE